MPITLWAGAGRPTVPTGQLYPCPGRSGLSPRWSYGAVIEWTTVDCQPMAGNKPVVWVPPRSRRKGWGDDGVLRTTNARFLRAPRRCSRRLLVTQGRTFGCGQRPRQGVRGSWPASGLVRPCYGLSGLRGCRRRAGRFHNRRRGLGRPLAGVPGSAQPPCVSRSRRVGWPASR